MMRINVKGMKEIEKGVKKVSNDMDNKYLKRLTSEGKQFGQRIMPYRSGALYQAFRDEVYKDRSAIIQEMPRQARRDPRPYHLWMAGIDTPYNTKDGQKNMNAKVFQSFIRKEPEYMQKTYEHLIKESGDKFLQITKNF